MGAHKTKQADALMTFSHSHFHSHVNVSLDELFSGQIENSETGNGKINLYSYFTYIRRYSNMAHLFYHTCALYGKVVFVHTYI